MKRACAARLSLMAVVLVGAGGWVTAGTPAAAAATPHGSADRGLYVALRVCAACHAVSAYGLSPDVNAPSFAAIRQHPSHRPLAPHLEVILEAGHGDMPPISLSPREIADVAAYIESVLPRRGHDKAQGPPQDHVDRRDVV